jgi:tripartite-type tricarboxylate transporter receptor subunit TctC
LLRSTSSHRNPRNSDARKPVKMAVNKNGRHRPFAASTPSHLAGELFKVMTGVAMTHVPYRGGGSAITDLLGGQVQAFFPA